MKTKKICKNKRYIKAGFTLVELLVAIAIIAIMAAVILISMQGYAKDARASKALGTISSIIPSMYSCWGNGGDVIFIKDVYMTWDGWICGMPGGGGLSYGLYPKSQGELASYKYDSSNSQEGNCSQSWCPGCPCLDKNDFSFYFYSDTDQKKICCNKALKGCKVLDNFLDSCTASSPAY